MKGKEVEEVAGEGGEEKWEGLEKRRRMKRKRRKGRRRKGSIIIWKGSTVRENEVKGKGEEGETRENTMKEKVEEAT